MLYLFMHQEISIWDAHSPQFTRKPCEFKWTERIWITGYILVSTVGFWEILHILIYISTLAQRFPIHCAVMGGNLDLVKWLVDAHGCPISMKRSPSSGKLQSVQTSKSRTLMDLVMTGRPKIDILQYFVSKNLSVSDTNDTSLVAKTLETLMRTGNQSLGLTGLATWNNSCDASMSTVEDAVRRLVCCYCLLKCVPPLNLFSVHFYLRSALFVVKSRWIVSLLHAATKFVVSTAANTFLNALFVSDLAMFWKFSRADFVENEEYASYYW